MNTRGKSNNTGKDFIEYCIFPKKAGAEEIPAKEKKLQQVINNQFSCRGILGHGRILWSWRNPLRRKKMLAIKRQQRVETESAFTRRWLCPSVACAGCGKAPHMGTYGHLLLQCVGWLLPHLLPALSNPPALPHSIISYYILYLKLLLLVVFFLLLTNIWPNPSYHILTKLKPEWLLELTFNTNARSPRANTAARFFRGSRARENRPGLRVPVSSTPIRSLLVTMSSCSLSSACI